MSKGIYLAAYKALHPNYNLDYQDINGKRDIPGDMLDVDLSQYDYIVATPPCNFWSRCNYRRFSSLYSLQTFHLLPTILKKLCDLGKPFIVENVRNEPLMASFGLFCFPCYVYRIGRHTYWTNVLMPSDFEQRQDFKSHGYVIKYADMKNTEHQGGYNVWQVIDFWLSYVTSQIDSQL